MAALRQSGKTLPEITYVCRHIRRMMPLLAQAMKPRAHARLDAMMHWATNGIGHAMTRRGKAPLSMLMKAASKNMHSNGYHHPWHTMTVMMMAGILGKRAGLPKDAVAGLVGYALIHDLDHRGRRMEDAIFAEEIRSASIAARRLFGRRSGCGTEQRQMMAAIKATSFTADDMGEGDAVTALLKDADIAASILFPKHEVRALTKGLKRETASTASTDELLAQFLKTADQKGFSHPASDVMAAVVRGHARDIIPLSAFMSAPSEGKHHRDAQG